MFVEKTKRKEKEAANGPFFKIFVNILLFSSKLSRKEIIFSHPVLSLYSWTSFRLFLAQLKKARLFPTLDDPGANLQTLAFLHVGHIFTV